MGDKAAAAARSKQPRVELMKGNKLGRQGGSGSQEQPRMEIMKGDKWRQGGSGIYQPKLQKKTRKELSICDHEERQAWETRRQRQLGAAQNGDHEGRQASETRQQQQQQQPRAAQNGDHKEDKLGRQGGSGSQEQPGMEIMKRDK